MADKLTPKQEAFAAAFIETSNASEAYRTAYDVGEDTKPESIWVNASKLLSDAKVAQRVAELQQEHRERHAVTVDMLTAELDQAKELALNIEQPAAMTSAIMGKAKLHGLLVDKAEHTGKNGGPIEHAVSKIEHTIVDPNATDKDS
jgi:phage terminase small subunit